MEKPSLQGGVNSTHTIHPSRPTLDELKRRRTFDHAEELPSGLIHPRPTAVFMFTVSDDPIENFWIGLSTLRLPPLGDTLSSIFHRSPCLLM